MKQDPPFEIPARTSVDLDCILETQAAGNFGSQITIFYDDLGLRESIITVRGTAR